MILFDLRCGKGHVFEAWFRNNATFEAQSKAKEIACPTCNNRAVEKAPMAPRIGKSGVDAEQVAAEMAAMRKQLQALRTKVEANCDYVGDKFAEEARRIHHGEVERRDIYGEASDDEARELNDEGIEFARIPWLPRHDS
ncbi:MAG TPA: DUF1178 family protein [Methylomirabilota bacterium]|nr:DUF1178 family protein [Methylomirabilota bacterium]